MKDILTARPALPAKWDERGAWRCPQCGELLAFMGHDEDGSPELRAKDYLEENGVWVHPENGFDVLPNARKRGDLKHAKKMEMRAQGATEEAIADQMKAMDWMFKAATLPRQGWTEGPDGQLEPLEPRSMPSKAPTRMETIVLPAIFQCAQCKRHAKIPGVG